jgi:hypothetical protein
MRCHRLAERLRLMRIGKQPRVECGLALPLWFCLGNSLVFGRLCAGNQHWVFAQFAVNDFIIATLLSQPRPLFLLKN